VALGQLLRLLGIFRFQNGVAKVLQKLWKERLQGGRSAYQQESFFATHLFECLPIRILVYRRFTYCREIDGKAGTFM